MLRGSYDFGNYSLPPSLRAQRSNPQQATDINEYGEAFHASLRYALLAATTVACLDCFATLAMTAVFVRRL